jgi:hypothetical protein
MKFILLGAGKHISSVGVEPLLSFVAIITFRNISINTNIINDE